MPPWRFCCSRWPWIGLGYTAVSAVIALMLVPVTVAVLLLLPLWGILLARFERWRLSWLGGPRVPSGHVAVPRAERHNWLNIRLTEPATWREVAYYLSSLVLGGVAVVALFCEVLAIGLTIAVPVMASRAPVDIRLFGDAQLHLGPADYWLPFLAVPLLLVFFGYLNAVLATLQGAYARWLLAPRHAEIDLRIEQLTRSRTAIVNAHEAERQRIERDLHDGVQQELVAIAARLGIMELELIDGTDESRIAALRAAQVQTDRALSSLRATARGIHPVALSTQGLVAALGELAAHAPIPLRLEAAAFPRLSPAAEAAGYFFVAETLTNAAKHTTASHLTVSLTSDGAVATISSRDEGQGGVNPAVGSGIAGLRDRAEALGGTLSIESPVGGPSLVTLTLPLTTPARMEHSHAHPAR